MSDLFQLEESEQRYRALFENNPDLVLFQDETGAILDVNPNCLAAMGKPKEEVINRLLTTFLPPELHDLFNQKLREAFAGHKVQFEAAVQFVGTTQLRMLNVTKIPLMVEGTIVGTHAVFRDVTELLASHQIIRDQADRLNTIFESITDAFFLLDRQWCFSYLNGEVERLLEVSREQLIGKNVWDVFPEEENGVFHENFQIALRTGHAVHFEALFEQQKLWLEVRAFPSKEGLSVYFSDVTENVKSREDMYRQNQDLQQFTYIVSHNLRAPLANLLGLADLLGTMPKDSEDYDATLDNLATSAHQLDAVLRDMNTILSIRDKQTVDALEQVLLVDIVQQACRNLEASVAQYGGEVAVHIPADLRVRAHRAYLYSIFFNLLSNAVKYRSHDRALRVEITAAAVPGQGVRIVVADNGSGFDVKKAGADVFRLYKRFHSNQPGRGMGLYLVKTHVETMGGHIEVASTVNEGTQFIIYLH